MNWEDVGTIFMGSLFIFMVYAVTSMFLLPIQYVTGLHYEDWMIMTGVCLGLFIYEHFHKGEIIKDLEKNKWIRKT